jgi:hypothetical protein
MRLRETDYDPSEQSRSDDVNVRIGSSFASSARGEVPVSSAMPWGNADDTVYVQSGRQALRLLSELLWSEGYRRLVLPGYLCESMITPFESRDWDVHYSPLGDRLRADESSYDELCLDRPDETVALIAEYFGRDLTEETRTAMARWTDRGAAVIEDRTHNLFDGGESGATYTLGSMRKLLPVGDGCFVQGLGGTPRLPGNAVDPSTSRWRGMDLMAARPTDPEPARELYRRAEADFDVALEPAAISPRSFEELSFLDFSAMRDSRRENFGILFERIDHLAVVNDDLDGGTPAFLVLRTAEREKLQEMLARRGIFCPILWPRPPQLPVDAPWHDDVLSVPVDQRYGPQEMEYIAETLNEAAKRLG